MPGFAKFLVFLNFLVACGFLYVATIDYNARKPWAREVFLGEVAEDGLPLDRNDPGPRRIDIAIFTDLDGSEGRAILRDLFANAGGNPPEKGASFIHTQQEEVEYQKKKINDELNSIKDEEDKRDALRRVILPLTVTLEERDFWVERIKEAEIKELIDDLNNEFFGRALTKETYNEGTQKSDVETGPVNRSDWLNRNRDEFMKKLREKYPEKYVRMTRRQQVAHLLYNLSREATEHTRVMVVIGLKAFIQEAELQAARLREMSLRTRMAMVDERSRFEIEYQQLVQRLFALAGELETKRLAKADKESILKRTTELVEIRKKDKEELEAMVGQVDLKLKESLMHQEWWEQQVFETQKALGQMQEQAETLQRYIRRLEGAGYK
ncbi:hypothetical protein AYO44_07835 [Planctomycetaceae bacterium SCGC AG-212-F19]|nr:hypothetical protein AYO44_07835 [Planctomycetaceae bacterium SCGC AG-212-F19]